MVEIVATQFMGMNLQFDELSHMSLEIRDDSKLSFSRTLHNENENASLMEW